MLWMQEYGTPNERHCRNTGHRTIKKYNAAAAASETEDIVIEHVELQASSHQKLKKNRWIRLLMICIHLMLANGKSINLVMNTYQQKISKKQMPVTTGFVGHQQVTALRDTRCCSVVVKEKFVKNDQYTETYGYIC